MSMSMTRTCCHLSRSRFSTSHSTFSLYRSGLFFLSIPILVK